MISPLNFIGSVRTVSALICTNSKILTLPEAQLQGLNIRHSNWSSTVKAQSVVFSLSRARCRIFSSTNVSRQSSCIFYVSWTATFSKNCGIALIQPSPKQSASSQRFLFLDEVARTVASMPIRHGGAGLQASEFIRSQCRKSSRHLFESVAAWVAEFVVQPGRCGK
jgi:hypothetical protein